MTEADSMWRLIGEVQRLGFESVTTIADRFRRMANENLDGADQPMDQFLGPWQSLFERVTDEDLAQGVMDDVTSLAEAWLRLMQSSWEAVATTTPASRPPAARAGHVPQFFLGRAVAGSTVADRVTISCEQVAESVDVVAGSMQDYRGAEISYKEIAIEPVTIVHPEAGSSHPVMVTVNVPADTEPGWYHGFVFAQSDHPTMVAVTIEVVEEGS